MAKPVPESVRRRIVELAKSGKQDEEIAKVTGYKRRTVGGIRAAAGVESNRLKAAREKTEKIRDEVRKGGSFEEINRRTGVPTSTVKWHASQAKPEPAEVFELPEPVKLTYDPFLIDLPGRWLVMSDVHIPCHDREVIEVAVREAKRRGIVGILLNGDILDCHEISDHDKDPSMPRYEREIEIGKEFLAWLRQEFPNADIVYNDGNHERRLGRYVGRRAPALEGLEGLDIPSWLHFGKHGVTSVMDKRVIHLGKLNVIHGDEYRGGGGVAPARWLYLKARSRAMCGHFHRSNNYIGRDIGMKYEAAWTLGCMCFLHPQYAPLNDWTHGFAFVELANDGTFVVENKMLLDGVLS